MPQEHFQKSNGRALASNSRWKRGGVQSEAERISQDVPTSDMRQLQSLIQAKENHAGPHAILLKRIREASSIPPFDQLFHKLLIVLIAALIYNGMVTS